MSRSHRFEEEAVDEPVWIEGSALKVALELGMRPEKGDEVRLITRSTPYASFSLVESYRGTVRTVHKVDVEGNYRSAIYHVSPSGWVHLEHIVAIRKKSTREQRTDKPGEER